MAQMSTDEQAIYLNRDILQTIHSALPTPYEHWLAARLAHFRYDVLTDEDCYEDDNEATCCLFGEDWGADLILGAHESFRTFNRNVIRVRLHVWKAVDTADEESKHVDIESPAWEDIPKLMAGKLRELKEQGWECSEELQVCHELAVKQPFNPIPTLDQLCGQGCGPEGHSVDGN